MNMFIKYLRNWDVESSGKVDHFIAISMAIQERVKRIYNRESEVIYPPVNTEYYYNKEDHKKH